MRPYSNGYTPPDPGFVYNPINWRNRKLDGYAPDIEETGLVPGAANDYTVELVERIVANGTLVVICNGEAPLTIVPYGTAPGANQVAVSYDIPLVKVNSAREGQAIVVQYTGGGGVVTADIFNNLQRGLIGKSDIGHTHTGVYSPVGHGHATSEVSGLDSFITATNAILSDNSNDISSIGDAVTALQTDKQDKDSDLTAVAGLSTTGLIARTGTGTAAARTLTGTANLITITNGNGVSGNPTATVGANVARLDTAQTFSAVKTFNARTFLNGVGYGMKNVYASSVSLNEAIAVTESFVTLNASNASYSAAATLPALSSVPVGHMVLIRIVDTAGGCFLHAASGDFIDSWTGYSGTMNFTALGGRYIFYCQAGPFDWQLSR